MLLINRIQVYYLEHNFVKHPAQTGRYLMWRFCESPRTKKKISIGENFVEHPAQTGRYLKWRERWKEWFGGKEYSKYSRLSCLGCSYNSEKFIFKLKYTYNFLL